MIHMIDVNAKELIFLVVFVAIIAVPVVLSALAKKKKGDNGKKKD